MTLKNYVKKRTYRERGQLAERSHLGLLEKKKDYVQRAKDYHFKQKRLHALKEKAAFRNKDEFYFRMVNSHTKQGVHIEQRNEKFDHEFLKLLKTQDQGYVRLQRSVNLKKIEKLKGSLHILGTKNKSEDGNAQDDEDEEDEEADADFIDLDGTSEHQGSKSKASMKASGPQHTIFVDDDEQVQTFNPAKHFETLPELVEYSFNRPRISQLEKQIEEQGEDAVGLDKQFAKSIQKERERTFRELASRLEREEKLLSMQKEMDLQKSLMGKGSKKKVGVDKNGLAVYKWKAERKR